MTARVQDIYIEQGATLLFGFTLYDPLFDVDGNLDLDDDGNIQNGDPRDLTDCIVRMQIRPSITSETIYVSASSESLEDDPEGGQRIFLGATDGTHDGQVDIVLTDRDTMGVIKTDAVYDIEVVHPPGSGPLRPLVERVLQGAVSCNLNVTRNPEDD